MRYAVRCAPSAQLLLRVLDHFAQRDVLPRSVSATGAEDHLMIVIKVDEFGEPTAAIVAEKLRALVGVSEVDLQGG